MKLITGPASSGKTARAIEEFLAAIGRGEQAVFIAPSGPDARHFHRQILRRLGDGEQAGILTGGRVTTFDGLLRGVLSQVRPGLRIIGTDERSLMLRTIVDETVNLRRLGPSASFPGFVSALSDLISELEEAGLDSTLLAGSLRSWARGNAWREDLNKELYRLFERYEAALKDKGFCDLEQAQRLALAEIRGQPDLLGYQTVVADGFWDYTPLQHDLLAELSTLPVNLHVTLPYEAGRVACEALARHAEQLGGLLELETCKSAIAVTGREPQLEHLVASLFEDDPPRIDAGETVKLLAGAGNRGQAEIVAAEILKLGRAGHNLDEIAIVSRGLGPEMTTMALVLDEFGIPYELPAPIPLAGTAVGKTALAALDFVSGSRSRASLLAYLRSPLSNMDRELVDGFERQARLHGWEDHAELVARLKSLRPVRELERLSASLAGGTGELSGELCHLIRGLISSRKNEDAPTAAVELRQDLLALDTLTKVCEGAAQAWRTVRGSAALPQAFAGLLANGIRQASVRLPGTALRNCVRLLDPHRILNQRFDTLFVCGLLEKRFPAFGREDSFFPDADRRELAAGHDINLKTREQRLAEERFLYFRTLSRARKHVYLCYPACDSEGRPNIRSLFVDDTLALFTEKSVTIQERSISEIAFPAGEAPTASHALRSLALQFDPAQEKSRASLLAAARPAGLAGRLESCLDRPVPGAQLSDSNIVERLGREESFRVTELQRYLRCPFIYFVERILSPADFEPVARNIHRGSLIHNILCRFNGQLSRAGLYLHKADQRQIDEVRRQMAGYIEEEFADAGSDLETLVLKQELHFYLNHYIDREIKCARPLEYYDAEVSFGSKERECGGKNNTLQELVIDDFRLRGRLDRVDRVGRSNDAIVIDYKASKYVDGQAGFADDKEIQIPLYMLALKDAFGLNPVGGEYYALRGDQRRGLYLKDRADQLTGCQEETEKKDFVDAETFQAHLEAARDLARRAVGGIRQGGFPHDPGIKKKGCDYCDYDGICRIGAFPVRWGEAEDEQ